MTFKSVNTYSCISATSMPSRLRKTRNFRTMWDMVKAESASTGSTREGGQSNVGALNHHRINFNKYHPNYFGKVGVRHYHLKRNQSFWPTVNLDKLWSLVSEQTWVNAAKHKSGAAPIIDVGQLGYYKIWGKGKLQSSLSLWRPNSSAEELRRRLRVLVAPLGW